MTDNAFCDETPTPSELYHSSERAWIAFGWAVHAGPIDIVPGFSWNMHLLNEVTLEGANGSASPMNIMINLGVEYGI